MKQVSLMFLLKALFFGFASLFYYQLPSSIKQMFGISLEGALAFGLIYLVVAYFIFMKSTKALKLGRVLVGLEIVGYGLAYVLYLLADTSKPIIWLLGYIIWHIIIF